MNFRYNIRIFGIPILEASFGAEREPVPEPAPEPDLPEWIQACPECGSSNVDANGEFLAPDVVNVVLQCQDCTWGFKGYTSFEVAECLDGILEEKAQEDAVSQFSNWIEGVSPSDFVGK
jgi:hypothetical protein